MADWVHNVKGYTENERELWTLINQLEARLTDAERQRDERYNRDQILLFGRHIRTMQWMAAHETKNHRVTDMEIAESLDWIFDPLVRAATEGEK